jgi:hypothetical protein
VSRKFIREFVLEACHNINLSPFAVTTAAVNGEGGECRRYLQSDL